MRDRLLAIGEAAGRVGLNASALRYYESVRVLREPERIAGHRVGAPPRDVPACYAMPTVSLAARAAQVAMPSSL